MWKKLLSLILITALYGSIAGCGKTGTDNNNSSIPKDSSSGTSVATSAITPAPEPEEILSPEPETGITKEPEIPEITEKPGTAEKPGETAKPGIKKGELSSGQQYADANRTIKFLGLKEYNKLEGDSYTDKPGKGNKFLVLFLSIWNSSLEEDYINYNYISAKIDNKKTEHTFLVNEPKSYSSIFTHIQPDQTIAGFIVWEVPAGWKKLDFTYNGWEGSDNLSVNAKFTPEDLSDPVIYNANDYM